MKMPILSAWLFVCLILCAPFVSAASLVVTKEGSPWGTIYVTKDDGSELVCSASESRCSFGGLAEGKMVALSVRPPTNGQFIGWGGACGDAGNALICAFTLQGANVVSVRFAPSARALLQVTATNGGRIKGPAVAMPGEQNPLAGIDCGFDGQGEIGTRCVIELPLGTLYALSVTPAPGYSFQGWSGGSCVGSQSVCSFSLDGAQTVQAVFTAAQTARLHVLYAPGGRVVGPNVTNAAGEQVRIDCGEAGAGGGAGTAGSDCLLNATAGTLYSVRAEAAAGYYFAGWVGACSGTVPVCKLNLTGPLELQADFRPIKTVILDVILSNGGRVLGPQLDGGQGIDCGDDGQNTGQSCTLQTTSARTYSLTAKAAPGYAFAGWTGGCAGPGAVCKLRLSSDTEVRAVFLPQAQTLLQVTTSYGGRVFGPSVEYTPPGGTVGGTNGNTTTVAIDCSLTGTTGGGNSGGSGATYRGCVQSFPAGTVYPLTATPQAGYCFYGWKGACKKAGSDPICLLTLNGTQQVQAVFVRKNPITNIDPNGCL